MLPSTADDITNDFEFGELPTKTFKLSDGYSSINGFTDGVEAVKQSVLLLLSTERYEHVIYSWNYGAEFANLIGQSKDIAMSEIKSRITEALTQDDRITSVDDWQFENAKNALKAKFTVYSIFGRFSAEKEVKV